jgi:hypothetical protein
MKDFKKAPCIQCTLYSVQPILGNEWLSLQSPSIICMHSLYIPSISVDINKILTLSLQFKYSQGTNTVQYF